MKKFCGSLREHAKKKKKIVLKKKKMLPLAKGEIKSHQDAEICYICGKKILKKFANDKIIKKLGTIVILQVNIEIQNI